MQLAAQNGTPRGLVKNDYFTWQPRIGFSWDLRGNGTLAQHAGDVLGGGQSASGDQRNVMCGTDTVQQRFQRVGAWFTVGCERSPMSAGLRPLHH